MNISKLVALEVERLLAVASHVYGRRLSLLGLQKELRNRCAIAETKEEIAYLVSAAQGVDADAAMVVNIVDSLIEKIQEDRIDGVLGFKWIEGLTDSLSTSAKWLTSLSSVIVAQVLTVLIVYWAEFEKGFGPDAAVTYVSVAFLLGISAIMAGWGYTLESGRKVKLKATLYAYGYTAVMVYMLYATDRSEDVVWAFGWGIKLMIFLPSIVPYLLFASKPRGSAQQSQAGNPVDYTGSASELDGGQLLHETFRTPGKVDLGLDVRVIVDDSTPHL